MIDIPARVKDALREGSYKKNYRFVVQKEAQTRNVIYIGTLDENNHEYTIREPHGTMICILIAAEEESCRLSGNVNFPGGGSLPVLIKHIKGIENFIRLGGFLTGSVISIYGSPFPEIGITTEDRISYTSEWVNDFEMDNESLVSESVNIDERMCSGDSIKYGLCEGASLEFQYFNHPNITGQQIQAFVDIQYDADSWHTIPMGFFMVKKCSRQASTGIIKVTAYNKLQSEYLDTKANEILLSTIGNADLNVSIYDIQNLLLKDFQIKSPTGQVVFDNTSYLWSSDTEGGRKATRLTANSKLTPLNSYMTEEAVTGTFYMYTVSFGSGYRLDPNKYYTLEASVDYAQWERYMSSYIQTYIDSSELNVTGEQYLDWVYAKTNGARALFCVELQNNGAVVARYTDMGYEKGANNVNGKFSDIFGHSFTGCDRVFVYMCRQIDCGETQSGSYILDGIPLFGNDIPYRDAQGVGRYYQSFRAMDGTIIINTSSAIEDTTACYEINPTEAEKVSYKANELPEFTLRDIATANYETVCQFGQLDRTTDLFSGVELNRSRLYPADTLYPDDDLYPNGAQESLFRSQYSKLWADEGNVHKWRNLIITYKGLDGEGNETEYTLQRQVNADGTDDYNCSDNWLFRNLVWTAEQIAEYAENMVTKMKNITWFPFEMWGAGLPYLETGDQIEIPLGEETYTSYILQRQLKGIQNLQDTYINGTLDIF